MLAGVFGGLRRALRSEGGDPKCELYLMLSASMEGARAAAKKKKKKKAGVK